jgi:hypothetical protein
MNPDEAAKILDLELQSATREKLAQRFEALHKANASSSDFPGSAYIQRKVANANTVLNDYLSKKAQQP